MKHKHWIAGMSFSLIAICAGVYFIKQDRTQQTYAAESKGCVFNTVFGEEASEDFAHFKTPAQVQQSVTKALDWLVQAQHNNGGYGAGSQSRQDIRDPHAVADDPATTSMVAMALLRTGNNLTSGQYSRQLRSSLEYLLKAVETTPENRINITSVTGTQIQGKLGANIDVILTSQFLSNVLPHTDFDAALKSRIERAQNICVRKIQQSLNTNGSVNGAGWAGVLQSSLATNALESAEYSGADVDEEVLQRSKDYQKSNMNAKTGEVNTDMGAGIVLYSVSGSGRASAKEAREVQEVVEDAKREGRIPAAAPVNSETLEKIGYEKSKAISLTTSYNVYNAATQKAQQEDVMSGFGNNGGEEFISYLQTGEAMVIGKDNSWTKWYDNMSGRLLRIQNDNGSWNGHHCITSPVFCTATCLLILAVNNDIEHLTKVGAR